MTCLYQAQNMDKPIIKFFDIGVSGFWGVSFSRANYFWTSSETLKCDFCHLGNKDGFFLYQMFKKGIHSLTCLNEDCLIATEKKYGTEIMRYSIRQFAEFERMGTKMENSLTKFELGGLKKLHQINPKPILRTKLTY